MCQINYTTENKKNKPLNQIEMGKIETMLNEGYNSTQIAKAIERDSSCIQKEIKNFSTIVKINKKCDVCKKYEECKKTESTSSSSTFPMEMWNLMMWILKKKDRRKMTK